VLKFYSASTISVRSPPYEKREGSGSPTLVETLKKHSFLSAKAITNEKRFSNTEAKD
jgi:hypothetical protein